VRCDNGASQQEVSPSGKKDDDLIGSGHVTALLRSRLSFRAPVLRCVRGYHTVQSTSAVRLSSEKKEFELVTKRNYTGYSLVSVHCTLFPATNFNKLKIRVFCNVHVYSLLNDAVRN
jgi:hypothetical protein